MPNFAASSRMPRNANDWALEYFDRIFKVDCMLDHILMLL